MNSKQKAKTETPTSPAMDDNWCIACHEAGHCVAVEHFNGLWWRAEIFYLGGDWRGSVNYVPATAYQRSVTGWAGNIGAYLSRYPLEQWPSQSLHGFRVAFAEVFAIDGISPSDLRMINGYRQHHRALNTAWRIVIERRDRLAEIARALQIHHELGMKASKGILEINYRGRDGEIRNLPKPLTTSAI